MQPQINATVIVAFEMPTYPKFEAGQRTLFDEKTFNTLKERGLVEQTKEAKSTKIK